MKKTSILFLILIFRPCFAEEGMWLPYFLPDTVIHKMQENGLKLTPEDIYSINKPGIKDAVVIFGNGCTGEVISDKGLVMTNYHCAYGYVQSISSMENNYLEDGFWAKSPGSELPAPELSVSFLKRIVNVTDSVLKGVTDDMEISVRDSVINENISLVIAENTVDNNYLGKIRPFYYGNEFYLFLYEEFKDIRLVGLPPATIGKFGGDTDNWMWPRHTGDFALYRIYADTNNKPAEYSTGNVPYSPEKYLSISLKGIKEGDFTWLMGFPGSTDQFLLSHEIRQLQDKILPRQILFRAKKLSVLNSFMESNPEIKIQYASKYYSISNTYKKWQGIIAGFERNNVVSKKLAGENDFNKWCHSTDSLQDLYGGLLPVFYDLYNKYLPYLQAKEFIEESFLAVDIIDFIYFNYYYLLSINENRQNSVGIKKMLLEKAEKFYRDYSFQVDKALLVPLTDEYIKVSEGRFVPGYYEIITNKFGSIDAFAEQAFKKSVFTDKEKFEKALNKGFPKIEKDPLFLLAEDLVSLYNNRVYPEYLNIKKRLGLTYKDYVKALREMQRDRLFYPDANFTLRLAYGRVQGYKPRDAVKYRHYTTINGLLEKHDTTVHDYVVPDKIFELYENNDFGNYTQDGDLVVCFLSSGHTSGGNSGSPVFNSEGHLIGINFDRCWEGTMSDYFYDPEFCRNIVLDIRYALFIIDKFAGAGYLLDEMDIVY